MAGVENCEADEESRTVNDDTEWAILPEVFRAIKQIHPCLSVDLFASRLNHKLDKYVSGRADPKAMLTDAFSFTCANECYFIFPPFSLIGRILKKVQEDKTEAVLIAPIWCTQSWWPSLLNLICGESFQIRQTNSSLYLPHKPGKVHPIQKMCLGVFPISGQPSNVEEYQNKHVKSSYAPGEIRQRSSITHIFRSGCHSVGHILTPFNPLLT